VIETTGLWIVLEAEAFIGQVQVHSISQQVLLTLHPSLQHKGNMCDVLRIKVELFINTHWDEQIPMLLLRWFFYPAQTGGTGGGILQREPRHNHPLGPGKVMAGHETDVASLVSIVYTPFR
jgi:hypothetical protein